MALTDLLRNYRKRHSTFQGQDGRYLDDEFDKISNTLDLLTQTLKKLDTTKNVTTVSALPAAAASKGLRYMVTDASATTFWSIVAGGGANTVPVVSDGTNWRIG